MQTGQHFKSLQEAVSSSLVTTTRTATRISAEDLGFHRSLDPAFAQSLDVQNARLLTLSERLLGNAASGTKLTAPEIEDAEAVDGSWRSIVDVIDGLLERADTCLDEYTGAVRRLSPALQEQGRQQQPSRPNAKPLRRGFLPQQDDMPKPQLLFETVPANNETTPFRPFLTRKPNAITPLEDSLRLTKPDTGPEQYQHPYQSEIDQSRYPPSVYEQADPVPYTPFDTTSATFVDTPEAVDAMLAELKQATEIAVDLEHHDTRSYIGMVSLMQISTRGRDWIIDTLKPWRRKLEVLNEVLTDPKIVKVLHGAHMDAVWLQRDLGLYLVGLFDTHHASKVLGYPGGSLAFLLKKFIDFDAQKQYQTADWRLRPLPPEMSEYARSDTHFLLYIYDNMRNELISKTATNTYNEDCTQTVLERSKLESLQRYEHPFYDGIHGQGAGWYRMLARTPALFSREQFAVFRAVHQWRDTVARQQDDSVFYVMANQSIFNLAKTMPEDMASLLGLCHPISPSVRSRASELVDVIHQAKAAAGDGPDLMEIIAKVNRTTESRMNQSVINSSKDSSFPTTEARATDLQTKASRGADRAIRMENSGLWGEAFGSSVWQPNSAAERADAIQLALPLPQLTAEIFRDPADIDSLPQPNAISQTAARPTEHEYVKAKKPAEDISDGIFIIKQLGGSRKRKAEQADLVTADTELQQDELPISGNGETSQKSLERKRRRAEKKAAKAERKLHERALQESEPPSANGVDQRPVFANGVGARPAPQPVPFDYASAPQIFNAPRERPDRAKGPKPINPYAKAADAPKGMRRAQRERAGKSATFAG